MAPTSPYTRMQHITISCAPPEYEFAFLCQVVLLLAAAELVLVGLQMLAFIQSLNITVLLLFTGNFIF